MRIRNLLFVVLGISAMAHAAVLGPVNAGEAEDGWIALFDGDTTFGWISNGSAELEVGERVLSAAMERDGWLATTTQFADFILKFRCRILEEGDVWAFFRAGLGEEPWESGWGFRIRPAAGEEMPWQNVSVTVADGTIHIVVDNKTTFESLLSSKRHRTIPRGHIGFGCLSETAKIEVSGVKLKPLSLASVFNGRDLTGWTVLDPEKRPSVYTVTSEGWLNVQNGPGDIQTNAVWQDFVLQLDVISNGDNLNSGVFFRAKPGAFWSGYESQIRNQWKGEDRTQPVDFGTGGLYGLQPARRVVPEDKEWFRKTVICERNHVAIWVNGYQTVDYTDTRDKRHSAAGCISLQGHDPTTNLSFRRIEVAPLPMRKD